MPSTNAIKFTNQTLDTADLVCPRCGGFYLHHVGVTLFERSEDEDTETVIDTVGATVTVRSVTGATQNPSSRRHGMVIKFRCELCSSGEPGDYIELAFAQHKGATEVSWRYSDRKPSSPEM